MFVTVCVLRRSVGLLQETLLRGAGERVIKASQNLLQTKGARVFFPPATFSQYLQTGIEALAASWQNTCFRGAGL